MMTMMSSHIAMQIRWSARPLPFLVIAAPLRMILETKNSSTTMMMMIYATMMMYAKVLQNKTVRHIKLNAKQKRRRSARSCSVAWPDPWMSRPSAGRTAGLAPMPRTYT